MFTTALWCSFLFLPRVFAGLLVSDVFISQSGCDTAVDLFKNKEGETPCTVVLDLLVPCHVNISNSSPVEISATGCSCNVAFYNLLSACALFCVKTSAQVDPFYKWSESCQEVVPMTREYPFADVITTDIPSWASKKLSSSGTFDPSVVMSGQWSTIQKLTPVLTGLGVLILVGLIWCFYRAYRQRRYSRRAQGVYPLGHRRNESADSYSSVNRLNPSQLSLPVHRIRFFFSGMLPVRGRRRDPGWNIEGEPELPRRSPVAYDPPPSRRESGSLFTHTPDVHAQNDTPPASPAVTWSPLQTISRWWTSANSSRGRDYQPVHLLSARRNSRLGTDDDNQLDPASMPPPQNQVSNTRNERTSRDDIPPVVIISNDERESASRPQMPQPETEPPGRQRLPSLRPNRPGNIVAVQGPSSSRPLPSADIPTNAALTPDPSLTPPGVRPQVSSDTFRTLRTTPSTDRGSVQTVRPKKELSPQLLFPPSVRAAGYSVPQRPTDPVVRAWLPRVSGNSNEPAKNPVTEPPPYNQTHSPTATTPRPSSSTSAHPYPYTNHLRSSSDVTVLDISQSPRPHLNTSNEIALNRLSLAVNGPTPPLPTTSEGGSGSGDGYTDFTPLPVAHGPDVQKNLEHTPYPSSIMLPLPDTGTSRSNHPSSAQR